MTSSLTLAAPFARAELKPERVLRLRPGGQFRPVRVFRSAPPPPPAEFGPGARLLGLEHYGVTLFASGAHYADLE